jgi:hypothetical protein
LTRYWYFQRTSQSYKVVPKIYKRALAYKFLVVPTVDRQVNIGARHL